MLAKKDRIRDGIHCDLCGCTSPAVRCDKCNSQIFCLSCDDMYHRHPKRRLHLRKAVDSIASSNIRPVTPNKPPPGDPSKMPIPPPRKKKPRNFFGTLMRGSPVDEGPSLPKKEFSWTDKFGTIKRFMSNRPLPPLPVESSPSPEPAFPLGTIYQNVPDRSENVPPLQPWAPAQHPNNAPFVNSNGVHEVNGTHNSTEANSESEERPLPPPKQYNLLQEMDTGHDRHWGIQRTRGSSLGETGKWGHNSAMHQGGVMPPSVYPYGNKQDASHPNVMSGYATFRKPVRHQSPHQRSVGSRSPSPSPKDQNSAMHQSASMTDLHSLPTTPGPFPYPYPPHPHHPFFPMFPAHSYAHLNCPQCYASPWPESPDNCEYCNSGDDSSHRKHGHHHQGGRVKRSQSVMYDSMNNPVPYFPFPPGYGPFYPHGPHLETPPSPASSTRSLRNSGRMPKRHTAEDNTSIVSSTRSREKSTSSGQLKSPENESMEISSDEEANNRQRQDSSKSPAAMEVKRDSVPPIEDASSKTSVPSKPWSCEFCTFINAAGVRICEMCCKTVCSPTEQSSQQKDDSENVDDVSNNQTSETTNDVPCLTSALAQAEKEMNIAFDKIMNLSENVENNKDIMTDGSIATFVSHFTETGTSPISLSPELPSQTPTDKPENLPLAVASDKKEAVKQAESAVVNSNTNHQLSQKQRKDSSCQTYEDMTEVFIERTDNHLHDPLTISNGYSDGRRVSLGTSPPTFHSIDVGTSPPYSPDSQPDRNSVAGMRRSLSRLSLNYGPRPTESRQLNQDWLGYGAGEPLYRSISHSSLISEPDVWSHDVRSFRKSDYYTSIDDLVERRRQEAMRAQGLELVRMIREAEQKGFTADDLQVALNNCGKLNPVEWLENNWKSMVETVVTLATNYGHDKRENNVGILSSNEAREALRLHKGNIWAAVTECVESRQRKYLELSARGSFPHKEIVAALTTNQGNVELAYTELTKASLKPFLMRIWGPGSGAENESGAIHHPVWPERDPKQKHHLKEVNMAEAEFKNKFYEDNYEFDLENNYPWADERSYISSPDYERDNEDSSIYEDRDDILASPDTEFTYQKPLDQNKIQFRPEDIKENKDETKKKRSGFLSRLTSLRKTSKTGGKKEDKEDSDKKISDNAKVSRNEPYVDNLTDNGIQETQNANVMKQTIASTDQFSDTWPTESPIPHENSQVSKKALTMKETLKDDDSSKVENVINSKYKTEKKHGLINVFKSLSSEKSKTESIPSTSKGKLKAVGSSDTSNVPSINKAQVLPALEQNNVNKEILERKLHNIPHKENEITEVGGNETSPSPTSSESIKDDFSEELSTNIPNISHKIAFNGHLSPAGEKETLLKSDEVEVTSNSYAESEHKKDGKVAANKKSLYIEQYKSKFQNKENNSSGAIPKQISKKSSQNSYSPGNKLSVTSSRQLDEPKKEGGTTVPSKKAEEQKKLIGGTVQRTSDQSDLLKNTKIKNKDVDETLSYEETTKVNEQKSKNDNITEGKMTVIKGVVPKPSGKESSAKSSLNKKELSSSPLLGVKNLLTKATEKHEVKMAESAKKAMPKKEIPSSATSSKKKEDNLTKKRTWISPMQRANEKQLAFERKVRRYLAEEKCSTYEKAEVAVQLIDMEFNEDDVIQAMQECSALEQAISYLQQDCELCVGVYPANKMIAMFHCPHRACMNCLRTYFTIQIRDRNIRELMCPYCNEPDLDNEDVAMDYFNHLDIMLKNLVDPDIHELFQQKLRDRVLMKDPSFTWCSQCSSGFIGNPDLTKVMCPDCKAVTCAKCRRLWEKQHDGISCEQFAAWKDANDPEAQAAGLAKHLTDNGIDCPNCKFRYSLAKGGCMHFRCVQCQYDFCSGCGKPFKMGQKCNVSEFCGKLGLHAHHPRNCLFYLRDKDPEDLKALLDENDIEYDTEPAEGMDVKDVCQVMEQKETPQGMKDDICGKEVRDGYAGLCRLHFIEYMVGLINENQIDPLPILDLQDLQLVLRRAQYPVPEQGKKETEEQYRETLMKAIEENVPLENQEES